VAFAGQLWTLSSFHRHRLTTTLVWGEVGAALGVVAGPMVGALFVHGAPEGWRHFFFLNASLGLLTAAFAWAGLRGRRPLEPEGESLPAAPASRTMPLMTGWQVAVSILIVGVEYFFSDHMQAKAGKSPLFVGGMTVLASVGAVAGSLLAGRWEAFRERIPAWSTAGLLASLGAIAACLALRQYLLAGLPILAAGLWMGLANVSIYAAIVEASRPEQFLSRSMIYLIAMQVGNALGVQAVGLAELRHLGVLATAGVLAALPLAIGAWAAWAPRPRDGRGPFTGS
jgi:predicted MFS family arabinose efflux permease